MGRRLSLSGSLATWALGVIHLQTMQLKMPLLATSQVELIPLVELIPFSDLITCQQIYIRSVAVWVGWAPGNKLHEIFPILKQCVVCPRTNRKEESVRARLHTGHSYITHSFLLKGDELPMYISCDVLLTIEYILLTCSDLIEIRKSHFTAQSLRMLFQEI